MNIKPIHSQEDLTAALARGAPLVLVDFGFARAAPRLSERYDTSPSMAQCSGTVAKQYFPHRPPPSADEAMLSESSGA